MKSKKSLLGAYYSATLPLISILLRAGVTWKEFAELAKTGFVEVASNGYGLRGRPTNASRVSILTGLSRREVHRQRTLLAQARPVTLSSAGNAARLLSGWHQDPDFLDNARQPRDLPLDAEGVSFHALARRYAGDIPSGALLKELVRTGCCEQIGSGAVRVLKRYYTPQPADTQAMLRAAEVLRDLAKNLDHNIGSDSNEPSRFEGRASMDSLSDETAAQFRDYIEQEAQMFLERVDDWLAAQARTPSNTTNATPHRLGLGIYLIDEQINQR